MAKNQVRVGVIGTGGMGQGHVARCQQIEEIKLTCICDIDPAVAKEVGKKAGVPFFLNHKDLLASGLVDAVTIATPHYDHPTIGIDAFRAGLHVLTEKPMCVRPSDADKFIAAWRKSGKVFSIMYQMRTCPGYRKAKELLDAGAIGEIRRTLFIDPWFRSQAYYDSGTWRATWRGEGGGVLLNQAPHSMDMFTWLGGLPTEVRGRTETLCHTIEVEDHAEAILTYANGATGYFYTSTNFPSGARIMQFTGNKGMLTITNGSKVELLEYESPVDEFNRTNTKMWSNIPTRKKRVIVPKAEEGHGVVLRNWARAILYGEERITPGEEGLRTVEFFSAIILSSKRGRPVSIPVDRKEYDALIKELCKTSKYKKPAKKAVRETDPSFAK